MLSYASFVVIIILVLLILFSLCRNRSSLSTTVYEDIPTSQPTLTITKTPTQTPIVTPTIETFTSTELGISFEYYNTGTIRVKEIGDKIYLYPPYLTPEQGEYIEVFPKDISDTLSQAIQKRFLQGKSEAQCLVEPLDYLKDQYVVKTYEFAEIKTYVPQNTDFNTWRQAEEQCSPVYATSQISYFLMDSAHPEKFLFINIGQDNFSGPPSNPNLTWEKSIRFIDK